MADKKEEEPKEKEEEKPDEGKSKKKKIILIILIVLILTLVGAGLAFFLMRKPVTMNHEPNEASGQASAEEGGAHKAGAEEKEGGHGAEKGKEHGAEEKKDEHGAGDKKGAHEEGKAGSNSKGSENSINVGTTFNFAPFHLNLGNPLENRYIRLEIALEYKSGQDQLKEIEARKPQLRDAILSVVSRKSREFLLGPDGKDQLRLELLNKVNQYMDRKVEAVYITDIIIE
ncbi:MAG: flagellar basal body-associated FliL family protein [Oligoflexales bacterium]|nr:flagellar basal body-associated FliL family protein [Oligoflexales bacterium]